MNRLIFASSLLNIGRLEGPMKNSIAGLFKKRKQADRAYEALQKAGFRSEGITVWVHKKKIPLNYEHRVSAQELGISAAIGAVVLGILTAFTGCPVFGIGNLCPVFSTGCNNRRDFRCSDPASHLTRKCADHSHRDKTRRCIGSCQCRG